MEKKIFLLITGFSLSLLISAQTLFVPAGTTGVGSSANNNVGVGTSTPGAKLEVSGDIFGSLDNSVITVKDDNIGLVKKWADSGVWAVGSAYLHRFGKWSTPSLIGNVSTGVFTEQMRIANNGYVGIGTTNPIDRLEISGGNIIVNRPTNKVDRNGISEFSAFEINNSFTSGQTGYVKVYYPTNNNLLFGADYDGHIGGAQPNIQFGLIGNPFLTVVNNGGYTGNIGIGTTTPSDKLEISGGNIIINRPSNKVDRNGINEFSAFEINNSFTPGQTGYVKVYYPTDNNLLFGADYDGHIGGAQPNIQFGRIGNPFLTVVNNGGYTGNIGIGTQNPAYKLDVLGTIRAKEVLVNLDGGADFVFEKNYKLLPIEHVATYVQENKHLPDIPSANEMTKNGVSMGDMQVKLLQKVEELTLYAIQQNKKIESLIKRIDELESK